MPKFKVLRPIELDGKLYLPEPALGVTPPAKAKSAGNGLDIPVDAGGVIELTDEQIKELDQGQVAETKQSAVSGQPSAKKQKAER